MFTIISDNDGHYYVIPVDKKEDWTRYLNSEESELGYIPMYAKPVGGCLTLLEFENYKIK